MSATRLGLSATVGEVVYMEVQSPGATSTCILYPWRPEFCQNTTRRSSQKRRAKPAIPLLTINPETWDAPRARLVKERLAADGTGVLDVEVVWILPGGELDDDAAFVIDAGAELGARNVLVASREPDVSRNADALRRLCERAGPAGMRVALEFLMIAKVRSLSVAHAIVQACEHPAAAILIDTLHLQRAGEGTGGLSSVDPRLFPYAQFCDGKLDCKPEFGDYLEDALDLRSAAGEGELPLLEIMDALPEDCPLSLEVRSKRYRDEYPRPVDRARAIRERTESFLASR